VPDFRNAGGHLQTEPPHGRITRRSQPVRQFRLIYPAWKWGNRFRKIDFPERIRSLEGRPVHRNRLQPGFVHEQYRTVKERQSKFAKLAVYNSFLRHFNVAVPTMQGATPSMGPI